MEIEGELMEIEWDKMSHEASGTLLNITKANQMKDPIYANTFS